MFEIGQKVRIKDNYWDICDQVYFDNVKPYYKARYEMAKSIGKIFYIKDKKAGWWHTRFVYLLADENGETDGFAWAEEFLEAV